MKTRVDVMNPPKTPASDLSPLEILAIRPKSNGEGLYLMVRAFASLYGRHEHTCQTFVGLMSSLRARGIPTTDEHRFASLLARAFSEARPQRRFLLLRRARRWLVAKHRELQLQVRSERGRRGGRGRRRGPARHPTLLQSVVGAVALKTDVTFLFKTRRFVVEHIATAIPGYRNLSPAQRKGRRDDVRKILTRIGLILPRKAVKEFVTRTAFHK